MVGHTYNLRRYAYEDYGPRFTLGKKHKALSEK
jgi:hypothetical protein